MFNLTTHSTHFIYGYMASDIWCIYIYIIIIIIMVKDHSGISRCDIIVRELRFFYHYRLLYGFCLRHVTNITLPVATVLCNRALMAT